MSGAPHKNRSLIGLRMLLLAAALALTPILTITIGAAAVPVDQVIGVLLSHIPGLDVTITWDRSIDAIVWETRLPRIIAGIAVAVILGVSGVVLHALAEPYVLGVSAGASTGAALAIIVLGTQLAGIVGLIAFGGALLATMLVLAIAGRTQAPLQLILGGLGVGFSFQAITNLIVFSSDSPETARSVMFWILGSLARVGWESIPLIVVTAVALSLLMVLCGPILDALASGDRTAQAVGVEPGRARVLLLIPVSAAIAVAVATAGGIGFVGLVAPGPLVHRPRTSPAGARLGAGRRTVPGLGRRLRPDRLRPVRGADRGRYRAHRRALPGAAGASPGQQSVTPLHKGHPMRRLIVPIIAAVVLLTGCGTSAAERASQATSARASAQGYPVEVVSCGIPLRLDAPPSKVLVLGETGFSNLAALGLVDRVALRAGVAHFDSAAPDLQATYDAIPAVDAGRGENGAVILSTEVALKAGVDLVIGYDEGVDREALKKAGVQLYSPASFCPKYDVKHATWDLIDTEVNNLASIFGVKDQAASVIEKRKKDVEALDAKGWRVVAG